MTNGPLLAVAVGGAGLAAAGTAALVVRPMPRLGPRVRPYTIVARARVRGDADATALAQQSARARGGTLRRLFAPPLLAVTARVGPSSNGATTNSCRFRCGRPGSSTSRPMTTAHASSAGSWCSVAEALHSESSSFTLALATLGLAFCGAVVGISRARGRIDRAIQDRTERIRLELYTVNQLLAMNVRTGAGPIQAVQRLVDRGSGAVVEELGAVLTAVRRGHRGAGCLSTRRRSHSRAGRRRVPTSCSPPVPSAASISPRVYARSAKTFATRVARRSVNPPRDGAPRCSFPPSRCWRR